MDIPTLPVKIDLQNAMADMTRKITFIGDRVNKNEEAISQLKKTYLKDKH